MKKTSIQEKILSATNAIRYILDIPYITDTPVGIMEKHKRYLLDKILWILTEAGGKYKTVFVSVGVKNRRDLNNHDEKGLHHEHVNTKKSLIDRLIDNPKDMDTTLLDAIGCVITKEEHGMLPHKEVNGWDRYKKAHIRVWNTETCKWKIDTADFV